MESNAFDIFMDYTRHLGTIDTWLRWSCLSSLAAVLERRVWFPNGHGGELMPNLYVALIGDGGAGKGFCAEKAIELIKEYNTTLGDGQKGIVFGADQTSLAAFVQSFKKAAKNLTGVPGKADFVQSAVYSYNSELINLLHDIGDGGVSPLLLKVYDCEHQYYYNTLKGGGDIVQHPCLNLLGLITKESLRKTAVQLAAGQGLLSRFIFSYYTGPIVKKANHSAPDQLLKNLYLAHLSRMHKMRGPMEETDEAREFFVSWFEGEHNDMYNELPDGSFLKKLISRIGTNSRKVAMVLSCARDSSRVIQLEDYERAIAFLKDTTPNLLDIFGIRDITQDEACIQAVLDSITSTPANVTEILARLQMNGQWLDTNKILSVIDSLSVTRRIKREGQLVWR